MSNVTSLIDRLDQLGRRTNGIDNGGGPPDDPTVDARIKKLEDDLSAMKTDVAVMRSNYVTKEDLHKELHSNTWKIIGTFALLCAAVFWMARNVTPPPAAPAIAPPAGPAAAAAQVPPAGPTSVPASAPALPTK